MFTALFMCDFTICVLMIGDMPGTNLASVWSISHLWSSYCSRSASEVTTIWHFIN